MLVFNIYFFSTSTEAANDPVYEQPTPAGNSAYPCWITCKNPHCLKHGCLKALAKDKKEYS